MVNKRHGRRWLSFSVGVILLMAACGGGDNGTSAESDELIPITFLTDFTFGGKTAPYALALEKGFFEDEGLDVEIREGSGSGDTVQLVAAGSVEIGYANTSAVVLGRAEGAPIKAVANFHPSSGFVLNWVKGRIPDLESPKDLEGKKVGLELGSGGTLAFGPLLQLNDVDESKIDIVHTDETRTALLRDRIDVRIGEETSMPEVELLDPSLEHGILLFSDFGVDIIAHSIIVTDSYLEENEDAVRAFVRASQRAWEYTMEHPEEAIQAGVAQFPAGDDRETMIFELEVMIDKLQTERVQDEPLGYASPEAWEDAIEILSVEAEGGTIDLPATDFYTNDLLSEDY